MKMIANNKSPQLITEDVGVYSHVGGDVSTSARLIVESEDECGHYVHARDLDLINKRKSI